jgi:hypothetical protein
VPHVKLSPFLFLVVSLCPEVTPTVPAQRSPVRQTTRVSVPAGRQVSRVGPGIVAPKVLQSRTPHFPKSGIARTWSGTAFMFDALIDETGTVRDVKTIKRPHISPPWPEVEEACRSAVLGTRYSPALRDGKPIPVYLTVTIVVDF